MRLVARFALAAMLVALRLPSHAAAQSDVELWAEVYGTRVPPGYYETLRRNPDAYRLQRGFRPGPGMANSGGGGPGGPLRVLGPRPPATGTFRFPVILGLYADADPALGVAPFSRDEVQAHYFDGPNLNGLSVPDYYTEVSGGRVTLVGEAQGWVKTTLTAAEVNGNSNGLTSQGDVTGFILQILTALDDGSIDWGTYDNDGPDGVPNSGDDDGFVDVLSVIHPTPGAECVSNPLHIWSHLWSLQSRSGVTFQTSTPAANGGVIRVNDYTITPIISCNQTTINEIGVFTHELGHGFGLPDLYSTGVSNHAGVGRWGLMGSGNFGCSQAKLNTARPCHMTAWSKEALGWADLEVLAPGMDHGTLTLDPAETGGKIYRVDANDGSGDYYLLENRQRLGSDEDLPSPGLMIWRVDAATVAGQWTANRVNASATRMGVWLQQADGDDDLAVAGGNKGDAGDPFPGSAGNTVFHAASEPASLTHLGNASGLTIFDVTLVGEQVQFRLLNRMQSITVRSEGTSGGASLFTVDGEPQSGDPLVFASAPFQSHLIEAAGGEPDVNGFRNGFVSWDDGSPRERPWTTGLADATLVATYGNPEVRFDVELVTPSPGVSPGSVVKTPSSEDGWILQGVPVSVMAEPRTGFAFDAWSGDLEGQPNPVVLTQNAPSSSAAVFGQTFGFAQGQPMRIPMVAVDPVSLTFEVVNGNAPVRWIVQGTLPEGLLFDLDAGVLSGVPVVDGVHAVTLRAVDAIGLQATLDLSLEIAPPSASLQDMAGPFLGAGALDPALETFLDLKGNGDGAYDLGDFRAYVLVAPAGGAPAGLRSSTALTIPVRLRREGGTP